MKIKDNKGNSTPVHADGTSCIHCMGVWNCRVTAELNLPSCALAVEPPF